MGVSFFTGDVQGLYDHHVPKSIVKTILTGKAGGVIDGHSAAEQWFFSSTGSGKPVRVCHTLIIPEKMSECVSV